ncbi:hypothetical protein BDW22DRAFT_1431029 [Trametopsis cervina]|nr:hypothetical protein BDW22DRAFT_1431029 [Trametopsis cervina]
MQLQKVMGMVFVSYLAILTAAAAPSPTAASTRASAGILGPQNFTSSTADTTTSILVSQNFTSSTAFHNFTTSTASQNSTTCTTGPKTRSSAVILRGY